MLINISFFSSLEICSSFKTETKYISKTELKVILYLEKFEFGLICRNG